MTVFRRIRRWPWLTLQIIVANVVVILALAAAWYFVFKHQSNVYSERLMSAFNIEPGSLHAMYVDDVERQLWFSVMLGLVFAIVASVGLALLIARPLRSLARGTERLQQGDYGVRSDIETGEVGRLARSFNALALALQREEGRRAQFMTDLGHELRTPIMSLRGFTEGLEDGIFAADESYFKLMSGELKHLTALTHTIETMRLDNFNACPVKEDPVTVAELLHSANKRWGARFQQRELQLEAEAPHALADKQLIATATSLQQIVDNLLSNMLRYATAGGPCRIEASTAKSAGSVDLVFSNDARDISSESLPFLFDRFFRVSQSRVRAGDEHSSGLGLSVVKQLCITNQGSVTASLNETRLSITVRLPIQDSLVGSPST